MFKPSEYTQQLDYSKPGICEQTLTGHSKQVSALTQYADGRLASGSHDNTIKLWDVQSGKCEQTLDGHSDYVSVLTLCADGRLASGFIDSTIKLWDLKSGTCQQTLKGHSSAVFVLTLCADGRLVSGSWDNTIKLWDVKSGTCEQTLKGHDNGVRALTQCNDGRLASGSDDKTIKLWDMRSRTCQQTLTGHSNWVRALTQCGNGRLASGSADKTIKLWDVKSGTCQQTLEGHSSSVHALTQCGDGLLVSGSADDTIKLWDVQSGKCEQTLDGHSDSVCALTLCVDGRLASGSRDYTIKLWSFPKLTSVLSPTVIQPIANHAPPSSQQQSSLADLRQQAESFYEDGKYTEALKLFRKLAIKGDASAQQLVVNIEKIMSESATPPTVKLAAKQDNDDEATQYFAKGERYFDKKDYENAKKYFKRAQRKGHAGAEEKLIQVEQLLKNNSPFIAQPPLVMPAVLNSPTSPMHAFPPIQPAVNKYPAEHAVSIEVPYLDLTIDKFKPLGKGTFGVVYKGKWQMIPVAVKELLATTLSEEVLTDFRKEAHLMAQLRHPNIVTFYKISTDKTYSIVMEWCEKGSLYDWLKTPQADDLTPRLKIGQEVAVGLSYLHAHRIIHCDMKSLNILLDTQLTAKINDFGLSKVKTETANTTGVMKGTLRWNPPELISGSEAHHSAKTDIYSYGMVLWELLSRTLPYQKQSNDMIVGLWITQGKKEEIPKHAPASMATLITKCWAERTDQRPTAKEAAQEMEQVLVENASQNQSSHSSKHAKQLVIPSDYRMESAVPAAVSTSQYRLNT